MSDIENNKIIKKVKKVNDNKIENPKGTITLNEAMAILKDKSNIEKMGLRIAAVRDGFKSIHTGIGKDKFLLDYAKFMKWIKNNIEAIPADYKLASIAAKELSITTAYVYKLIKKHKIKNKKIGGGKGKIYVDFPALKNVIEADYKYKRKR